MSVHREGIVRIPGREPAGLTKRERVDRAIRFEAVDRVPLCGGYIMVDRYLAALAGCSLDQFWSDKVKWAVEAYHRMDVDMICQLCLPSSPDQFRGGYSLDAEKSGRSPESIVEDVARCDHRRPLEDLDLDALEEGWVRRHDEMQALCGDIVWLDGFPFSPLPFWHYETYGYEAFFSFLLLYEEEAHRYAEYQSVRQHAINARYAKVLKREGWPFLYFGDDIATTRSLLVSPRYLARHYWPFVHHAMEPFREADVDVVWHCDGNLTDVIPQMIQCGLTGFQGGQAEAGMIFEDLAFTRVRGGRLPIMFGALSVTTELPRDYRTVTAAVEHQIDVCARRGGGHLLFMTNTACPDCPLENILGAYEHAREYSRGRYHGLAPRQGTAT
jgi:hypothetical protein